MPKPDSLGEGNSSAKFCNSNYMIPIYVNPHFYQDKHHKGQHQRIGRFRSNQLLYKPHNDQKNGTRKATPGKTQKNMEY